MHHCFFCGWHRAGASATMVEPTCERCGCTLEAAREENLGELRQQSAEVPVAATRRHDAPGVLALILVVPWILPMLGVHLETLTFVAPLIALAFGASASWSAASRATAGGPWRWLAVAATLASVASGVAVIQFFVDGNSRGLAAYYVGSGASVALAVGIAWHAWLSLRATRLENLLEGSLFGLVLGAVALYFVGLPGLARGNVYLTLVFLVDLAAVLIAALSITARAAGAARRVGWWLLSVCAFAAAGDAVVSGAAASLFPRMTILTALTWALAGYALAIAADGDAEAVPARRPQAEPVPERPWLRVVVPMSALVCFPALALVSRGSGPAGVMDPVVYFGASFVVALALILWRQAYLLIDHHRAITDERRLRDEAIRRNGELEALTKLATTMTQSLEEQPIVEQALSALHAAARATSAALHTTGAAGTPVLAAASGAWSGEHAWAGMPSATPEKVEQHERGGRAIARLPLRARGTDIGVVTLARPEDDPFTEDELGLLLLLVDEFGVAVQNARDYREKLEQAIRDPLTGLYNRRFFLEVLGKEVARSERYGSDCSLIIFDVDDFKSVNDTHGHTAGDEVLRGIGATVTRLIRPVDIFARLGGEEFGLLLPETNPLEALIVADRVRAEVGRREFAPARAVRLSGGISSCPADGFDPAEIQKRADAALYWSKRHGKDICAVASEVNLDERAPQPGRESVVAQLASLVAMIDGQHLHTREHSQNVAAYAVAIARELGMDDHRLLGLRRAALLHDIGKVGVPAAILNKPDRLTEEEFAQVVSHAAVGAMVLAHAGLHAEATWVRHHHERMDGRGYPDQLAGAEIPLEARILFVADSLEAMTSDRPYHKGMPTADAVAELRRCAGTQFDPAVVDAAVTLIDGARMDLLALRDGPAIAV